jgi:hypothetical protein
MREMTMIAQHGATVLQFTQPRVRAARNGGTRPVARDLTRDDGPLPDNVVSLARFARESRRARGRFWIGGPPEGEAA